MNGTADRLWAVYPTVVISLIVVGVFVVVAWGRGPAPVEVVSAFDLQEAAYIHARGEGAIAGRAFVRLWSGEEVSCTGKPVLLVPETAFSRERIEFLYGGTQEPGVRRHLIGTAKLMAPAPEYREYMRRSPCEEDGTFHFEGVADGAYFVVGSLAWRETGGVVSISMMQPIELKDGKRVHVTLTPRSESRVRSW